MVDTQTLGPNTEHSFESVFQGRIKLEGAAQSWKIDRTGTGQDGTARSRVQIGCKK